MIRVAYLQTSILLGLFCALCAQATPFHAVIVDETGAAFPDVLVIVRSLEGDGESFRVLTDLDGAVPKHEIAPGLYQLIANCPFGVCQTALHEFLVASDPIHLQLPVKVVPTGGDTFIPRPVPHRVVTVRDTEGKPIASATIFVRDGVSEYYRWYRTSANGKVTIDVLPQGETTIVVIHDGKIDRRVLQPNKPNKPIAFRF